jgi:dATP pyrophosphohydrolase
VRRAFSVAVYARRGERVLVIEHRRLRTWLPIGGELEAGETPLEAAARELREETGLEAGALRDLELSYRFPILPQWRARYAPNVRENLEHAFALEVPAEVAINMNPAEHAEYGWFAFPEAARKASSWTNREVIVRLQSEG